MPRVFPFEGLTYDVDAGPLGLLTAPPYDVISEARRRAYLSSSPYSVVHLDGGEGSQDPGEPENRYARAARFLGEWQRDGELRRATSSQYYAYEMTFALEGEPHRIRGLFVALELEPWGQGVLPHERTMSGPVEDRLRLLRATKTHLSAVYGAIAGPCAPLAELLEEVTASPPSHDLIDEQSVRHRMWSVDGRRDIGAWFTETPILIADGHHRYTTALRYRDEMHERHGPGPWDRVLAFVVDAAEERLPVLPFHRVQLTGVPPVGGTDVPNLAAALASLSDAPPVVAAVTRTTDGLRYAVVPLEGSPPAVRALATERLSDLRAPEELAFTPDADEAVGAVADGEAVAAWLLPPTTPERIRGIIEQGERLPQKSTYFWPKPRTGMVMMPVDITPAAVRSS